MSLTNLLKRGSLSGFATATSATSATHGPLSAPTVATVATVAVANAQNLAANDPAESKLGDAENHTKPVITMAANDPAPDPDRWCWPYSSAMNGAEIDTFTARLHQFTKHGLTELEAEKLADKLVIRDREGDDRRVCVECTHLSRGRCNQSVKAELRVVAVSADLTRQLQRCKAFNHSIPQGATP